jgi:hypothetical protein
VNSVHETKKEILSRLKFVEKSLWSNPSIPRCNVSVVKNYNTPRRLLRFRRKIFFSHVFKNDTAYYNATPVK